MLQLHCRLALAALCTAMAGSAAADQFINIGGGSYHFERDLGHNEFNPGIGYERDWNEQISWAVGYYKNSLAKPTFYAVGNYYPWRLSEGWRVGATVGALTGYNETEVAPLLAPTLEWRGSVIGLQFFVVPSIKPYVDGAFVGQVKFRLP